jgi:hypothetical protein
VDEMKTALSSGHWGGGEGTRHARCAGQFIQRVRNADWTYVENGVNRHVEVRYGNVPDSTNPSCELENSWNV